MRKPLPPGAVVSLAGRNFIALNRDRLGFLVRMAREHGDIVQLRLGSTRVFLLSHPDHIKDVLVTGNRNFIKGRGTQRARLLLGNGLLTSEGEYHLSQRRIAQPAFHRQQVSGYAEVMVRAIEETCASWNPGEVIDVHAVMSRLTLTIAGPTLFGVDLAPEAEEIRRALTDALDYFEVALLPGSELLDHMPLLPVVRRFRRARHRLDATVARIAAAARAAGPDRQDVAALLARGEQTTRDHTLVAPATNERGVRAGEELHDEIMTLLVAGYETVSDALAWTWQLLAEHPDAEARLHAELDDVLGGRCPEAEDLPRLPYTRAVFAESLRLYPTAYIAGYQALEDHALSGGWIPRGSLVLMCQYIVHRDERWFPSPERFRPERWLDAAPEVARPRHAYFPFGAGPRRCIGEHFAWLEGTLVVAAIARRWRLAAASPSAGIWATLTLRPASPILARLEAREATAVACQGSPSPAMS